VLWRSTRALRCRGGDRFAVRFGRDIGSNAVGAGLRRRCCLARRYGDRQPHPLRAYYTDVNAKLQSQAIALGGEVNYLTPGEGEKADKINFIVIDRIWNLWKMRILPTLAK
jgi:hypothetical protein